MVRRTWEVSVLGYLLSYELWGNALVFTVRLVGIGFWLGGVYEMMPLSNIRRYL